MYAKTHILIYFILHNALSVSPMAIKTIENNPSPHDYLLISSITRWLVKIQNDKQTLLVLVSSELVFNLTTTIHSLNKYFLFIMNVSLERLFVSA